MSAVEKIAGVERTHLPITVGKFADGNVLVCGCDHVARTEDEHALHVAQALVDALGIVEERRVLDVAGNLWEADDPNDAAATAPNEGDQPVSRLVSGWVGEE